MNLQPCLRTALRAVLVAAQLAAIALPGAPLSIETSPAAFPAGAGGRFLQLGRVNDPRAQVTINGRSSATVNGVTISSLAVNGAGAIRGLVSASCRARNATFLLAAAEANGRLAAAALTVRITPDAPPTLEYEDAYLVAPGGALTIRPRLGPSAPGGIEDLSLRRVSPAFSGRLRVNAQGVVAIEDAPANGSYRIAIRATDRCGRRQDATFTLAVGVNLGREDGRGAP